MGVHVKYPSMERQDLTQAQLGSFKFTPVDEERYSPQAQHHPLLLQQYAQSLKNGGFERQLTSPDIAADPSFFNHQIRPSLDESRLRFGPAAVRAAVESASSSPQKRFGRMDQAFMRPNVQAFQPLPYSSSDNDSWPSIYTSEVNSASMHEEMSQAFSNTNNSLLKALETEQESHHHTKAALEHEINARQEAEAKTRGLTEHNRSLLNSIKLLQSTVKHMVQKENQHSGATEQINDSYERPEITQEAKEAAKDSILYDVLANYKVPHTTTKNGKETTTLINLDLLNAPHPDDKSEKVNMQRTLRQQMGLSPKSEPKRDIGVEHQPKMEALNLDDTLLMASSELNGDRKKDYEKENQPFSNGQTATGTLAPVQAAQHRKPATALATPDFIYSTPSAFLNKYSKKPTNATSDVIKLSKPSSEGEVAPPTPRKASLTVISAIKVQDVQKPHKPPSRVILMPDSPMIDWKVDGRHVKELRGNHVETHNESHFTDHPIRYVPKMADENIYRTVMIDFIPWGTKYSDVLAQIRGGTLESVQLYGPVGDATDFVTARIVFTDETAALNLYQRGQDPGIKINGQEVRVWQVQEPTYPKNRELEEAIYSNGHTRILIIDKPPEDVESLLKQRLRKQIEAGLILDIGKSHDGMPLVEFTSIEEATKALYRFVEDRGFRGANFDFEDDYCAAQYVD